MSTRRRPRIAGRRPHQALVMAAVTGAAVALPLAVGGPATPELDGDDVSQVAAIAPVKTAENEVSLGAAPAAKGVPKDIAGGAAADVREITSPTPFTMVGITWKGRHDGASATIRARQADGSWGPWYTADAADGGAKRTAADARGGTEPIFVGAPTTAVQIHVTGVEIASTSVGNGSGDNGAGGGANRDVTARSADVKAVLLNPGTAAPTAPASGAAPSSRTAPAEHYGDAAKTTRAPRSGNRDVAAAKPAVFSRAQWGADESIRCSDPYYDDELTAATVHHTAGNNNYSKEDSASIVRGIYTYHAVNLGWCDIGYHTLVDKYGQAFEGAYGGLDKPVEGAHAGGFNTGTYGISMMGDYSQVKPTDATIQKVGEMIGWRLSVAGIDPKGKAEHESEGTSYTFVPQGESVSLPNIFAHRDVGTTTCPGDTGYAQMSRIRDIAAKYASGGGSSPSTSQPTSPSQPGTTEPSQPSQPSQPGTSGPSQPSTGDGVDTASAAAAGTALKELLSGGTLDAGSVNSLLKGGKLADLGITPGMLLTAANGGDLSALWSRLGGSAGPLGKALSGVQTNRNVSYVKFDKGAIYHSQATGAHAVWGRIGDAWAAQGYEHGPLGMPLAEEAARADGTVAQRFQGGTVVFTPKTGAISVQAASPAAGGTGGAGGAGAPAARTAPAGASRAAAVPAAPSQAGASQAAPRR